jgi:hypothetical protein
VNVFVSLFWVVALLSWPIIVQALLPAMYMWLYPYAIWLLMIVTCIIFKNNQQANNHDSSD